MHTIEALGYKLAKRISAQQYKIKNDTPVILRFESEISYNKPFNGDEDSPLVSSAMVTDLESGDLGTLLLHQVLEKDLLRAYPNGGITGKVFLIEKTKESGKKYFSFKVSELEPL